MSVAPRRQFSLALPGRASLELGQRTLVMGVLNVTPDSFSDGSEVDTPEAAIARALALEAAGADMLDVGAESTRPGAEPIDGEEEWRRLRPVLKAVGRLLRIPISIDTYRAETARRALDAGVSIVNDVHGLGYDAGLGPVVAARRAALILMHSRGGSRDMYRQARYDDVLGEVARELQRSVERAIGHGVSWDRLIIDPGLGFAKQAAHSLAGLAGLAAFADLGRPVLAGPSRKSFLTAPIGPRAPAERDWATAAAVTAAVLNGAHIVRVHRVAEMVDVVRVADAIRKAAAPGIEPARGGE